MVMHTIAPARIVVAAPASGHGKTTVATGIMAALAARGLSVSPHKVGPDYIDPTYHAMATGRPGRNLDPFLVGSARIAPLFLHGTTTPQLADIAIIEGVMGLYDGAVGRGEFASTAHVAKLLAAPLLLVVDASSQGRSVAALVEGFANFDEGVRIGGVVLNRVGSDRHERVLRMALDEIGIPVLGALARNESVSSPSRHLGLIPVAERVDAAAKLVETLKDMAEEFLDLDAILALANSAGRLSSPAWSPTEEIAACGGAISERPRIALFGGAAFTFQYAETLELLEAAGAEVVLVDPLMEIELPLDTSGVLIGGGFPEMYAEALAKNVELRERIAAFAGPIVAECAGLLYLARSLDGHQMCGVVNAQAEMTDRLTLGYREASAVADSLLTRTGEKYFGHEFHRTQCTLNASVSERSAWSWESEDVNFSDGYADDRIHASYLHLHWAGSPQLAQRFVSACAKAGT
ncbi:cobyrinic acid A,C-diamide synthase [mine drainage metagenome]|uniref:Cobyrinic acid A,C-diamide synthase n=1 Tax=mine drainage metagenome TaxID=410659 RepID=A0A1J5PU94_9ZZZZ